jgi:hypothetical protein
MKLNESIALLAGLALLGLAVPSTPTVSADEGVAVAIVYDTSGSMKQSVPDSGGRMTPKHVIARRAMESVVKRLQNFATNTTDGVPRKMEVGVFVFENNGPKEFIKLAPFDPQQASNWAQRMPGPSTGTPLGTTLQKASEAVLNSKLSRKHVLVITDGVNTVGPEPATVLPRIKDQAARKQTPITAHFVAFDIDAKLFDPLKKQGVTVVGAANEEQLNSQLGFILEKKILLEDEEPPTKPKSN